jgi:hypothetical protein
LRLRVNLADAGVELEAGPNEPTNLIERLEELVVAGINKPFASVVTATSAGALCDSEIEKQLFALELECFWQR